MKTVKVFPSNVLPYTVINVYEGIYPVPVFKQEAVKEGDQL